MGEIYPLINKEGTVVKIFRLSPTKNDDLLQKYVKTEFKKEIQLIIDVETRWNSLHFMLGRFDKLRHCVMKSLIDLKSNIVFDEIEMNSINDGTCYVSC